MGGSLQDTRIALKPTPCKLKILGGTVGAVVNSYKYITVEDTNTK